MQCGVNRVTTIDGLTRKIQDVFINCPKVPYHASPYLINKFSSGFPHGSSWRSVSESVHSGHLQQFFNAHGSQIETARTLAYDRFWKKANDSASAALTLWEAPKSLEMIAGRLGALTKSYRELKKGNLSSVFKLLGISSPQGTRIPKVRRLPSVTVFHKSGLDSLEIVGSYPPKRAKLVRNKKGQLYWKLPPGFNDTMYVDHLSHPDPRVRKVGGRLYDNAASLWLEFTFGWSPLVEDVYKISKKLAEPPVFQPIRAKGKTEYSYDNKNDFLGGWFPGHTQSWTAFERRISGFVHVSNPNLAFFNSLGLANPALVVWDGIPFSFVVDWFFKVNKYLESYSVDFGLSVNNACTTESYRGYCDQQGEGAGSWYRSQTTIFNLNRTVGLPPRPDFSTRWTLPTPSLWLAATASSLAVQVFSKK